MLRWIRSKQGRIVVHSFVASGLVTTVTGFLAKPDKATLFMSVAGTLLGLSVLLEISILMRPKILLAPDHPQIYDKSHPLAWFIKRSSKVEIVGGTLLSLTDQERNLAALARVDGDPKILLMHPEGFGISAAAKNRAAYREVPSYNLKTECWRSLSRIVGALGAERSRRCVRLYRAMPTTSIYSLGGVYILTCYTFGRGGGSPSMLVRRGANTKDFCDKLDTGIQALWNSADELTQEFIDRVSLEPDEKST